MIFVSGLATVHIRQLIGCFESCHYKAERHMQIIIEAIESDSTTKAQGRRDSAVLSPRGKIIKL